MMRLGQLFLGSSDNPHNHEAAHKFIYAFKPFVPEDQIESVLGIANLLDFETAAACVSQFGEEEYEWAQNVLWEVANAEGHMNERQKEMWDRFIEIYWDFQEPDDKGAFDAYA